MDNQPNELHEIRSFYDANYYPAAAPYSGPTAHLRRLAARVGIREGQRILDVG